MRKPRKRVKSITSQLTEELEQLVLQYKKLKEHAAITQSALDVEGAKIEAFRRAVAIVAAPISNGGGEVHE